MTLATDLATLGVYDSTDITNMVGQAYDILSLHYGSTLAEDTDEDWDRIAKIYAIHLLDRLALQKKSLVDPSVSVPPLMTDDIRKLINQMQLEPVDEETKVIHAYTSPYAKDLDAWNP